MPYTQVTRDQFDVAGNEVVHRPTGARFTAYPNMPAPHLVNWGHAGNVLPNGDDYDLDDIQRMALQLMRDRLKN